MSLRLSEGARAEWRSHWRVVVAAGCGLALMNVPIHSIGVFMASLTQAFGWTRSLVSSGMIFLTTSAILLGPVVGWATDRWGPRRFALAGGTLVCLIYAAFSLLTANPLSWWTIWLLMAGCYIMVLPNIWLSGVCSLFAESRGLALALALSGASISNAVLPLLGTALIQAWGWRLAYVGVAVFYAVFALPVVFLWFSSARDSGRSGGAVHAPVEALDGDGFLKIATSWKFVRFVVAAGAMMVTPSVMISIIPIATSFGLSTFFAAGMASLLGLTSFAGRLIGGYLLDRVNGNALIAVCMCLPASAVALILIAPHSPVAFTVAALLMGLCVGVEMDAVAYLTTRHFGVRSFGSALAFTNAIQLLVYTVVPLSLSYLYDRTASYRLGLMLIIPVCLVGAGLFMSLGKYRYAARAHPA